jgi:hypothetical protein
VSVDAGVGDDPRLGVRGISIESTVHLIIKLNMQRLSSSSAASYTICKHCADPVGSPVSYRGPSGA